MFDQIEHGPWSSGRELDWCNGREVIIRKELCPMKASRSVRMSISQGHLSLSSLLLIMISYRNIHFLSFQWVISLLSWASWAASGASIMNVATWRAQWASVTRSIKKKKRFSWFNAHNYSQSNDQIRLLSSSWSKIEPSSLIFLWFSLSLSRKMSKKWNFELHNKKDLSIWF